MSIRELRVALPSIEEVLEEGGEVVVTRHGKPVARLTPVDPRRVPRTHADLRAATPKMAVGSEELVRAERLR